MWDSCDEIWNQEDYEERLETEAELMIALEAIREALVKLDYDITDLETCIETNAATISHNYDLIYANEHLIAINDAEIEAQ